MLVRRNGLLENMLLPRRDVFGFCDNFKSPIFLEEQENEGCIQQIRSLQETTNTYLNPLLYTDQQRYLAGSATTSSLNSFTVG